MSTRGLLVDTAARILSDHCDKALQDSAEQGVFPAGLLEVLTANGILEIAMPDSGLELGDAYAVIKESGRFAVPLPLAEMVLANRWLDDASQPLSVGVGAGENSSEFEAPWGRAVKQVVVVVDQSHPVRQPELVTAGQNLAGEARDIVAVRKLRELTTTDDPGALLALARIVQMAGALERVLEMTLHYASEREQFGRPISKFQAIQHNLAVMASEVAAASRASDAAVDGLDTTRFLLEIAAAKARVGEAVGIVAESAHQIHGAMGYTHEHQLHHYTRRLWAWRDEHGTEAVWQQMLGEHVAALGADSIWDFIATRG